MADLHQRRRHAVRQGNVNTSVGHTRTPVSSPFELRLFGAAQVVELRGKYSASAAASIRSIHLQNGGFLPEQLLLARGAVAQPVVDLNAADSVCVQTTRRQAGTTLVPDQQKDVSDDNAHTGTLYLPPGHVDFKLS